MLRILTPLDVLQLNIDKYVGSNVQPENWTLAPASHGESYTVLGRFDGRQDAEILDDFLNRNGPLLHSYSDSVRVADVETLNLTRSLALVSPEDLHWSVSPKSKNPNELQVRAYFLFDQDRYSLVLTDPLWEAKCRQLGRGLHPHSTIAGDSKGKVLLTISLAEAPLHGFHYKLVAGIVSLPA